MTITALLGVLNILNFYKINNDNYHYFLYNKNRELGFYTQMLVA